MLVALNNCGVEWGGNAVAKSLNIQNGILHRRVYARIANLKRVVLCREGCLMKAFLFRERLDLKFFGHNADGYTLTHVSV